MGALVAIPALIATYVALRQSVWRAYLNVFIPVLLLLPMYYRWFIPTNPTFEQAAILPIAIVFFARGGLQRWRFSFIDLVVFVFVSCFAVSEYLNTGYKEAQNLFLDMTVTVLLPYVLTKALLQSEARSVALAKQMVMLFLAVSILSVYEFRMGVTLWLLALRRFFPGQALEWGTTFRYGFARIAGPYGHAILAGLVLCVGFRLQRWLEWRGEWEPYFTRLRWLRISKARLITLGLIGGIVMTMVRGPWLGGFAGAVLTGVGRTRQRKRALLAIAVCVIAVGVPAASMFWAYASVGRAHAKTESQETAAYRVELIGKYLGFVGQKPWLGYGKNTWPQIHSAPSIDNYYLLLSLMHGLLTMGLFVAIMLIMIFRLMLYDMRLPVRRHLGGSLGFTLAGIYVLYAVTLATVYMGLQAIPVFAVITGWSEAYLTGRNRVYITARPAFSFKRVVV